MSKERMHSANGKTGAFQIQFLQNTISKLEEELLLTKTHSQKVTDQLNCLMFLVKKAWTGDQNAAIDVANIVGVAPPDYDETVTEYHHSMSHPTPLPGTKPKNEEIEPFQLKTFITSKSRAVNNWAILTIGLLNHSYSSLEREQAAYARQYLLQRQAYLQDQLVWHKDAQFRAQIHAQQRESESVAHLKNAMQQSSPLRRVNSLTELHRHQTRAEDIGATFITQPHRQQSAKPMKTRPASSHPRIPSGTKHLYRPANQNADPVSHLTWADLVIEPGTKVKAETSPVNHTVDTVPNERPKYRQRRISYDDPHRYDMGGLYDVENALGPGSQVFRRRPPSATQQRQSDHLRARPKSAVYAKNERPLKYETTRPVSAKVSSKLGPKRPPSGKKTPKAKAYTPVQNGITPDNKVVDNITPGRQEGMSNENFHSSDEEDINELIYDEKAFAKLGIDLKEVEREIRKAHEIKVNITKPKSVVQFEEDMQKMHNMEKTIKRTTVELQKKLGIVDEGIVY